MLLSLHLEAQNIVQNGGFENIEACPTGPSQIWRAEHWDSSGNSPDLYNSCSDDEYSVPVNVNGTQSAHNGNSYGGIGSYVHEFEDTREIMQNELRYPLSANSEYYLEFYVSLSDSSKFASHNLGVTFTGTDPSTYLTCYPNCDIYVENNNSNPLTSKDDWIKISGTFIAGGGEKYLHISNLRTDSDSEVEPVIGGGVGPDYDWNFAAYYIDDVWLSHVDSAHYVGIDELGTYNYQFELYPNPSEGGTVSINCNLRSDDVAELRVFDMSGRQVYRNNEVCGANVIELTDLSEGIYHCLLVVNGKASLSEKLVILRD